VYSGWSDIRLPFLQALARRGFQPEAFWRYAAEVGVTQHDKKVPIKEFFKAIETFNREIIDEKADRYFVVLDPKRVRVRGAPQRTLTLDRHPEHRKGGRTLRGGDDIYLSAADLAKLKKGQLFRLKDYVNVKVADTGLVYHSDSYETYRKIGQSILHFLPAKGKLAHITVRMPDNSVRKGLAEQAVATLPVGTVFQAERVGFMRLDRTGRNRCECWFCHS
jgi:glutamyl-tRNA synthetase